jgi:hypothetical protein
MEKLRENLCKGKSYSFHRLLTVRLIHWILGRTGKLEATVGGKSKGHGRVREELATEVDRGTQKGLLQYIT